ncbi:MAG: hypothetical protein K2J82_11040 [Muribaculaceae bacterium]|nr:hypothetical protein [Muribaculaceae bacterium]MDE6755130.1 hypothetical protein [Muribaculaceae bacterium]
MNGKKLKFYLPVLTMTLFLLSGCSSSQGIFKGNKSGLLPFSGEVWRINSRNGNAISTSGLELGFGCKWMVTDTTLLQTPEQISSYPKFAEFLKKGIRRFPEIMVDSILFYHLERGLLFAEYHQVKPLKPTSEISLYNDSIPVYSKDWARIFGIMYTCVNDNFWEKGPEEGTVFTNLRYSQKDKQFVLLQRIPYKGRNIAVFHICSTIPRKGKWWEEYPYCIFSQTDYGNTDNIDLISVYLNSARTVAVDNLKLSQNKE